MNDLPLAIVGCGGMGGRHILGLKELYDSDMSNVELVAACDLRRDNADIMLYYMGDVRQIYGEIRLWKTTREKARGGGAAGFYERWAAEMPDSITTTAEDTLVSVVSFSSDTMGQWIQSYAGHGRGFGARQIFGSRSSLIPGDALLALVPDFRLDEITAHQFGAERMSSYSMPFPDADRNLLAIEFYELPDCVQSGQTLVVDGLMGRRAMALCYASFESSVQNRPVTLDEIEAEEGGSYDAVINAELGS